MNNDQEQDRGEFAPCPLPDREQRIQDGDLMNVMRQDVVDMEEGCLSFPGIYVNIKRPTKIKARWQNSRGEFEEGEFDGYNCKCFLHEYDHLEGITFQDRVSTLKWALAVKKTKKRNHR